MKQWIVVAALLAASCSGGEEGSKLGDRDGTVTKADARAMGGVDDNGEDICDVLDWYGDGVCDDFCVEPDSDCDTNNEPANNLPTNNDPANNEPTNNEPTNNEPVNNLPTNNTSGGDCGGIAGLVCADTDFCNYPDDTYCGAADQLGTCEPRPEACAAVYEPVCGCDGNDYGNACTANSAGVDVAADGECATACAADSDCAAGESCVAGVCEASAICAADSDCARGELCVDGACTSDPTGATCGARSMYMCPAGYFCDWDLAGMCGRADATGTCQETPQFCADIYDPVCGCDGMTYSNECEANGNGVSALSEGECVKSCVANTDCAVDELCINGTCTDVAQGQCGGFAGFQCAADEWCDYPDGTMCGAGDQSGTCQVRPQACPAVFAPVCGCDNMTYSNGCVANSAGVDVYTQGACP